MAVCARRCLSAREALVRTATLLLLLGAACGRPPGAPENGPSTVTEPRSVARVPDDPQLRRGFEAWAVLCAPCHGQTGKGDGAVASLLTVDPGDLTDRAASVFTTDHERMQLIADGLPGSPMIGWKDVLNDDEIAAVNAYLRHLLEAGDERSR